MAVTSRGIVFKLEFKKTMTATTKKKTTKRAQPLEKRLQRKKWTTKKG